MTLILFAFIAHLYYLNLRQRHRQVKREFEMLEIITKGQNRMYQRTRKEGEDLEADLYQKLVETFKKR